MDFDNEAWRAAMNMAERLDDGAIDRWVQRSLRERYDPMLREPVPDALTRLLAPDFDGR
jgi:hypothetical protein